MATVVPVQQAPDVLGFALKVAGFREEKKQAAIQAKQTEAALRLKSKGLSLDERRVILSEASQATTLKYQQAQIDRLLGNEKRDSEIHDTERELKVLGSAGLNASYEAETKKHKLDFLNGLTDPLQVNEYYMQRTLMASMQQEIRQKTAEIAAGREQRMAASDQFRQQQTLSDNKMRAFNQTYRPTIDSYAGTVSHSAVAQGAINHSKIIDNKDATPEQRLAANRDWNKVLSDAAKLKSARELTVLQGKEEVIGQQSLKERASIELLGHPELFKNIEEYNKWSQAPWIHPVTEDPWFGPPKFVAPKITEQPQPQQQQQSMNRKPSTDVKVNNPAVTTDVGRK